MMRSDGPAVRRSSAKARIAPRRGIWLLLAILCLLTIVGASTALADDTDAAAQEAESFVPGWTSQEAQENAVEESPPEVFAPPTDSQAAESLPRDDLGRGEASELLTAVFGEVLGEAAGIFDELEVERFHSDYAAIVGPEEPGAPAGSETGEPGLLTSLLPLRAENSEGQKVQVDLDLQQVEGDFLPENPLVEVEIPGEISQGISLPEAGVTVDLAGAPAERTASALEGSAAFYPNVAPDSDLTVLPTPTGFETSTVLRTPDAPLTQTYELTIPQGAHLDATKEGGAAVVGGGETLVSIPPPTAMDAEGDAVSVSLDVEANAILIHASPVEEDAFPILVDPIFESYYWDQYPTGESPEWFPASSPCFVAQWNMWASRGLSMYSCSHVAITPGSQATWNYYVPRFFTDMANPLVHERPTTYIKSMTMASLTYSFWEGNPVRASPHVTIGIWSEAYGNWVSVASQNGIEGPVTNKTVPPFINYAEVTDAKNAGISLASFESSTGFQRNVMVGQATVEISDKDSPAFGSIGNVPAWVNGQVNSQIQYIVTDPGLGIYQLQVNQPSSSGGTKTLTASPGCLGSARGPCPRTVQNTTVTAPYDPSTMPQGENWLKVTATDPVEHKSAIGEVKVKVDHTKPSVALSGTLTEQAALGTKLQKYTLNYSAADGDETAAEALPSFGGQGTAPGKMEGPTGIAVEANGNLLVVDHLNKRVMRYDKNGTFLNQFGTPGTGPGQMNDPYSIAIGASGNVWITEMANARVQVFTSSGTFIRQITCQCFSAPYAIAAGPSQAIWMADIGNDKLFKYNEAGTQLLVAHGNQANPGGAGTDMTNVTGLTVDPSGNVWAAEFIMNKLLKFDAAGNYVAQIAPPVGSGNGQVVNPSHVSMAPSGHLLVNDYSNSRMEEFTVAGAYVRKFGSLGSGAGQMNAPSSRLTAATVCCMYRTISTIGSTAGRTLT
jgi:sugar lactone lactonase YvrE